MKGHLIITLEEPGGLPAENVLIQVGDSATNQSKRIDLVPGRTFHLHCCESESEESRHDGNNPLTAIWYYGDEEIAAVSSTNHPMVYSYLENNRRTLVLTSFMVGNVGVYRCRERGTSNTEGAAVVIGTSEQMYTFFTIRGSLRDSSARLQIVSFFRAAVIKLMGTSSVWYSIMVQGQPSQLLDLQSAKNAILNYAI